MTGIICVNKKKDITSFGVVSKLRGITSERKVGHTGTLDPMATGVLPVMLGGATRFLNYIPDSDKRYTASFRLGMTTDTLDITGTVLTTSEVDCDPADVERVLSKFRGEIEQVPPMYSAKSVDGVRLYELAREGKTVEREACGVEIKKLDLLSYDCESGEYVIDVLCSKGTYIRSLIDDIGRELGCGAVMTALERTQAMGFTLDDCVTLDELQDIKDTSGDFSPCVTEVEKIFSAYKKVNVSSAQAVRFFNGGELDINRIKTKTEQDEIYSVYDDKNMFLGLGKRTGGDLKVLRVLSKRD